jgi:hypothetical protein
MILHHLAAHPREFPQITQVPIGDKTGPDQSIFQQITHPLRIFDVLRPGTFLMWQALASISGIPSLSRTFHTGC